MSRFTTEQWVDAPRDDVFAFFSSPQNLERITPPWVGFRILTPSPIPMAVGTRIRYRIRIRGFPVSWESLISAYDPPHRFVDEQVKGPYRTWIHEHRFEDDGERTRILDDIRYSVPGGRWVDRWMVRPDVERIFEFRQKVIAARFGSVTVTG